MGMFRIKKTKQTNISSNSNAQNPSMAHVTQMALSDQRQNCHSVKKMCIEFQCHWAKAEFDGI